MTKGCRMTIICLCVPSDTTVSGWQKVSGMTIICLCMSSGPPPLDDKRRRMTIICLWVLSNTIVSEWRKGEWNDHNLSPHVTWPQGQYDRDCGAADKSETLAPTYPQWGIQTYVVLDNNETKIVSAFSSLKCERALVKRQNFQLIRATYAFWMKNNVSTGKGEYADEIFS